MAEQLAENYHNVWAKKKKSELESKGKTCHLAPLLPSSLLLPPQNSQQTCNLQYLTRFYSQEGVATSLCPMTP